MSTWASIESREATERNVTGDLLRPLRQTSWRFYVLVAFLGSIVCADMAVHMGELG